ncbi:efflux RND transporter periplasmic adaptor subunit [Aneurinibacillus sp. Ricciae_BoGa-3]|uniref:efflux RND transporter periplasmic adaptor subunit n=1 Tax=Aneurinibacillus sp. Ricciae_BoGa-3 TaxID=3022697 RepID=UPI002340875E|nr:efflux RND transporter periplasmic adaptor subunit [Aneurinibacillus sp. Ricciae_BoGa-3]WCK54276.1 efflux RND transporter periplasmic adaptor subunit [Aneurinibacillus sp. Ricciae_BoGa-3]
MRKVSLLLALSLCASTAAIAGCSTNAAVTQDIPTQVTTAIAANGSITMGPVYTGTIQASDEVRILPKIGGKVVSLPVDVGTSVKSGQTLFTIDNKDYRNNVAKAEAAVQSAVAGVQGAETQQQASLVQAKGAATAAQGSMVQAKTGIISSQAAINQAQSSVDTLTHNLGTLDNAVKTAQQAEKDAQTALTRAQSLFNAGAAPQSALDQAQTGYVNAQAAVKTAMINRQNWQVALDAAKKALVTAQNSLQNAGSGYSTAASGYQNAESGIGVAGSNAGIEAMQSNVNAAQVNLKIAQDALGDTVVYSPINGIVSAKNIQAGEMVSPQSPVAPLVITNIDTVKVLVYIPANQINGIKTGDKVQVKAVALNTVATGTVTNISPSDSQGKGYPVMVTVQNPTHILKAGMVADVTLVDPAAKQGIIVPSSAIVNEGGKMYVIAVENGIAKRKAVTVGQQQGSQALVTAGISPGTRVVTDNAAGLSDGDKVVIDNQGQ